MNKLLVPKQYEAPAAPIKRFAFRPKPDITAYELAQIIPFLTRPLKDGDLVSLKDVMRHLPQVDDKGVEIEFAPVKGV